MNKALALILLLGGAALLVVGINMSQSVTSETTEALTGSPTDKALWLMIGGGVVLLGGLLGLLRPARTA